MGGLIDTAGNTWGNRFFFSYTGGTPSGSDLTAVVGAVHTAWTNRLAPNMLTGETLTTIIVEDLSSASGGSAEFTGSESGTATGGQLQADVAAVINHQVTRRYRGGRPRIYLRAGITSDLATPAQFTDTFITNLGAAWHNFVTDILSLSGAGITLQDLVNVSYYEGFTVVTNPVTGRSRNVPTKRTTPLVDPIIGSNLQKRIGSQKRRRGKAVA